jgi:hypothetical protein
MRNPSRLDWTGLGEVHSVCSKRGELVRTGVWPTERRGNSDGTWRTLGRMHVVSNAQCCPE